jgi:hypothetical protein
MDQPGNAGEKQLFGDPKSTMMRTILSVYVLFFSLCSHAGFAQQAVTFKNFASFKQIVKGIDFYASNRQQIAPYEKRAAETIARLETLLGTDLPRGAIFVCSTLAQKDSIYEPKVLRAGYGWTLTAITPEVRIEEMLSRIKSQLGGEIPAEIKSRINNRPPEMLAEAQKQMVDSTIQQIAHAVVWALLDKESQFRSSRLDDMGKSPLPDWLDIGIASYASGREANLEFLKEHMDQTFPLEDVLAMSRPFVASSIDQGSGGGFSGRSGGTSRFGGSNGGGFGGFSGGQGMPPSFGGGGGGFSGGQGMSDFGSRSSGGFGGRGTGQRGNSQRILPKDEQDRMLFDSQASTFFSYLLEKVGLEKVKLLIKQAEEGKESREFVTQSDVLGTDLGQIESDWAAWVQALSPPKS